MPPKSKATIPKTKCIKFGEILMDENKRILMLCVNCFQDFFSVAEFCKHLRDCKPAKHIFQADKSAKSKLEFDRGDLLTTVVQKTRELQIYGVTAKPIESNICDIETEILDPRWYTDAAPSSPIRTLSNLQQEQITYNNIIEEVTPFVQFKENVSRLSTPKQLKIHQDKIKPVAAPNNKQPSAPNLATPKTKVNNAINQNQKNTKQTPKNTTATQVKPACARNLISAPTSNVNVKPSLKRKSTELLINQATATTAKQQHVTTTTVYRSRISTESSTPTQQLQTAMKDISPKKYLNQKTKLVVQNQPQKHKIQPQSNVNRQRTSSVPTQKQPNNTNQINKWQKPVVSNTVLMAAPLPTPPAPLPTPPAPLPKPPPPPAVDNKRTVDILNKLQTLGLKVQRTNPKPRVPTVSEQKNAAAMEIIKKLQSKGMEIKRVPKQTCRKTVSVFPPTMVTTSETSTSHMNPNMLKSSSTAKTVNFVQSNYLVRKYN